MKPETMAMILHDFEFLGSKSALMSEKEIVLCLNTYLFALAQHDIITSAEYKEIGDIVVKNFVGDDE